MTIILFICLILFLPPLFLPWGNWLWRYLWTVAMIGFGLWGAQMYDEFQPDYKDAGPGEGVGLFIFVFSQFSWILGLAIRLIAVKVMNRRGNKQYGDLEPFRMWRKSNQPLQAHWLRKIAIALPIAAAITFVLYTGRGPITLLVISPAIIGFIIGVIFCDVPVTWAILSSVPGILIELECSWNNRFYLLANSWSSIFVFLLSFLVILLVSAGIAGYLRRARKLYFFAPN
ncbi:hypothetical protein [Undibacterium terreum]|uniref:hypothetical protein n=1 Tax=Undibacterium terreum TaxID=1224302 RepID=UPI00166B6BE2|nr:hypothetical protein [Undibacterium terreum]